MLSESLNKGMSLMGTRTSTDASSINKYVDNALIK